MAPSELRVDVQRAVSPAPASVLPLSVSASLETLHLDVAQSDVTLVYSVIFENLAEGRFAGAMRAVEKLSQRCIHSAFNGYYLRLIFLRLFKIK